MKTYQYLVRFSHPSGQSIVFRVYAACVGNAKAIAWQRLADAVGDNFGYRIDSMTW